MMRAFPLKSEPITVEVPSDPTANSCTGKEVKPFEEMLTISGADWFSHRGGTCRLRAIYLDQLYIHVGKADKLSSRRPPQATGCAGGSSYHSSISAYPLRRLDRK